MNLKKDLAIVGGLFLVIIALMVFGKGFTSTSFIGGGPKESTQNAQKLEQKDAVNLTIKTLNINAKVADTSDERKKGFSKIEELPISKGMLFVFDNGGKFGIWMKDMRFAIDILWIDKTKKIVDIAQNVAPEPGKKDKDLTVYKPRDKALYVLEINAGLSSHHNLQIGDEVNFEL